MGEARTHSDDRRKPPMFGRREMDKPGRLASWLNDRFVEFIQQEFAQIKVQLGDIIADTIIKVLTKDSKLLETLIESKMTSREVRFVVVVVVVAVLCSTISTVAAVWAMARLNML